MGYLLFLIIIIYLAGAQKWLEAQETKIVAEEILSEILNVICKDDVISQFQTYFAGSKRV